MAARADTVGPGAKWVAEEVEQTSELYLGDDSITVSNDGCTNWPLEWYVKDLPNHRYMASTPQDRSDLPDIIVGVPDAFTDEPCAQLPEEIPGYASQMYLFRWHEPEALVFRNFAIAPELPMGDSAWTSEDQDRGPVAIINSIWSSLTSTGDPDQQQKLWRLLMYREQPGPMTSIFSFKVYVHRDVLPYYSAVRYGQ